MYTRIHGIDTWYSSIQAYWAYKWIPSPCGHCSTTRINIKVYKSVNMYTSIHGIMVNRHTGHTSGFTHLVAFG